MVERQANPDRGAAARRHIIERPRLTRLLGDVEAPIVLLVAPAGYGKTTLARQWLADKPHAWHAATTASADVAALAARLADAASEVVTESDASKLDERLHHTPDPEKEVEVLTDFVARCFSGSPSSAWLAIDDYHLLMDSPAAEALVAALPKVTPVKLIVTSRQRPAWATARRIMYGEIYEIGRHDLAMDATEAEEVLQRRSRTIAPGLVALAGGWPAVIGMASLTDNTIAPDDAIDDALYEFFAQEFFNTVDAATQELLCRIAVMPTIKRGACDALLRQESVGRLRGAEQLGLLSRAGLDWQMHPLLRKFLLMKYRERAPDDLREMAVSVFEFALVERDWDAAFSVGDEFEMVELFEPLIRAGLNDLLTVGRLATLRKWVNAANRSGKTSAAVRIAEAEIAFREGSHIRAEALAAEAIDELSVGDALRAQGLFRAGQAAYFNEHYEAALDHFDQCVHASDDLSVEREARWAAFVAALDSHHPETLAYLEEFARVREPSVNDAVRMANAQLIIAMRRDGVTEAVAAHLGASHLVGRATDPMIRTAFWNTYGWALALNSRYEEARRAAANELEDAEAYRLSFVKPHAQLLSALAAVGMRDLSTAQASVDEVFEFACEREDLFLLVNASAVLARLYIARGDCSKADAATATYDTSKGSILYSEYLGVRAVVLASLGESEGASDAIAALSNRASQAEAQAFAKLAGVIVACNEGGDAVGAAQDAIVTIKALGQFDAFVTAYRAFPGLVDLGIRSGNHEFTADVLRKANDVDIARRYGVPITHPRDVSTSSLSRREEQVLDLVAQGRTNEEVAGLLFISPVTVKAHLRHIYEKLGVRNRVEAAARLTKERALGPH
jgi:LuxR family maltose regulon positive regulatory protein